MSPHLDEALVAQFPLLYKPYGEPNNSFTRFGFECGNGWYTLIYELSVKLHRIVAAMPDDEDRALYRAQQVKSKFGQLRWYSCSQTYEMTKLINEAEGLSVRTCEICGNPGSQQNYAGWIDTRCSAHRK